MLEHANKNIIGEFGKYVSLRKTQSHLDDQQLSLLH